MTGHFRAALAGALAIAVATVGGPARAAVQPGVESETAPAPAPEAAAPPAPSEAPAPSPDAATEAGSIDTPVGGDSPAPESTPPQSGGIAPDLLEEKPQGEPAQAVAQEDPPELPPQRPSAVSPPPPGLALSIQSSGRDKVELFRIEPSAAPEETVGTIEGFPYVRVCVAPCEQSLRNVSNDAYFVAGPQIMPSRPFTLVEYDERVTLRVRPGPKRVRFAGFGLTVAGAILVPGGALLAAGFSDNTGARATGFSLIGVGVGSLVAGIVLLVRGRTLIDLDARARGPGRQEGL